VGNRKVLWGLRVRTLGYTIMNDEAVDSLTSAMVQVVEMI